MIDLVVEVVEVVVVRKIYENRQVIDQKTDYFEIVLPAFDSFLGFLILEPQQLILKHFQLPQQMLDLIAVQVSEPPTAQLL